MDEICKLQVLSAALRLSKVNIVQEHLRNYGFSQPIRTKMEECLAEVSSGILASQH